VSIQKDRLDDEVERVSGNLNAAMARIDTLEDRIDELEEELAQARTDSQSARERSKRALAVAQQVDDGTRGDGGPSKTRLAAMLSRDDVVRQASKPNRDAGGVTAGDVVKMARGRNVDVDHRLVFNAWGQLVEEWSELRVDDRDDRPKRLVVDAGDVSDELAHVVAESSDDDRLAERFNSRGS